MNVVFAATYPGDVGPCGDYGPVPGANCDGAVSVDMAALRTDGAGRSATA